jgi:hypothetical protein
MLDSSLFEQLLFYEFAPATGRDIFKRWALKLSPSYKTEPVRNICFSQLIEIIWSNIYKFMSDRANFAYLWTSF